MDVLKVYTVDGEVHSYPVEDAKIVNISKDGHLEISQEIDSKGNQEGLLAGYPKGTWRYYRVFKLKGARNAD